MPERTEPVPEDSSKDVTKELRTIGKLPDIRAVLMVVGISGIEVSLEGLEPIDSSDTSIKVDSTLGTVMVDDRGINRVVVGIPVLKGVSIFELYFLVN